MYNETIDIGIHKEAAGIIIENWIKKQIYLNKKAKLIRMFVKFGLITTIILIGLFGSVFIGYQVDRDKAQKTYDFMLDADEDKVLHELPPVDTGLVIGLSILTFMFYSIIIGLLWVMIEVPDKIKKIVYKKYRGIRNSLLYDRENVLLINDLEYLQFDFDKSEIAQLYSKKYYEIKEKYVIE